MNTGRYYLWACVDQLRESKVFFQSERENEANIKVMPNERPFPGCGLLFIGLRIGDQRPDGQPLQRLAEKIEIVVSVTMRTTVAPSMNVGEKFYVREDQSVDFPASLDKVCSEIVRLLDRSDSLLGRIQTKIENAEGPEAYPATSPLYFARVSPQPQVVDHTHFNEFSENDQATNTDSGLLQIITFDGGERMS